MGSTRFIQETKRLDRLTHIDSHRSCKNFPPPGIPHLNNIHPKRSDQLKSMHSHGCSVLQYSINTLLLLALLNLLFLG